MPLKTCLATILINMVISDDEVTTSQTTPTTIENVLIDAIWCPTSQVGNQCPEETLLSFYKCCGHLNKECCFHLRIVIMVIVLPTCLLLPAVTFLIRRLICLPKFLPHDTNQSDISSPSGIAASTSERVRQLAAEESEFHRRDSDDMVML